MDCAGKTKCCKKQTLRLLSPETKSIYTHHTHKTSLLKVFHVYLEGSKPHEPVEAVVVGRNKAGAATNSAWFAVELNLKPVSSLSMWAERTVVCTFQYYLCPLLCYTVH